MLLRISAGLLGVAVVVPTVLWGGVTGVDIITWIVLAVAIFEYVRMALPDRFPLALLPVGAFACLIFGGTLYLDQWQALVLPMVVALVIFSFLGVMIWSHDMENAADDTGRLVLGAIYLGGLLCWVPMVRRMDDGITLIFLLLTSTWLGDTGAYFSGRAFGRHRMAPRLSPNKTWEGFVGGLVAAVLGAVVVGFVGMDRVPVIMFIVLGALVDTAGVLGDLAESMLKRSFGVKDSGGIMPGHGGILDRIDSLLFSAPVLYLAASLLL